MVLSDPNFDVVDIKADVSSKGNVMLTSVTAVHKTYYYRITNILVFIGGECYVRDQIELIANDSVLDVKIGETWKVGYKEP